MTEAEWLASDDPRPMLRHLRLQGAPLRKAGRRKLRLFGCACCRRVWHLLTDENSRKAVEVGERLAEGLPLTPKEVRRGWGKRYYHPYYRRRPPTQAATAAQLVAGDRAWAAAQASLWAAGRADERVRGTTAKEERKHQAALVRCVFGNPFRPAKLAPSWLKANDGAVKRVAQTVYEEGAFDRVAVLGDALEDAGCDDEAVLSHCRGGPHVRGCWVVDLVLGKGKAGPRGRSP